jgi:hypothetical protein
MGMMCWQNKPATKAGLSLKIQCGDPDWIQTNQKLPHRYRK